MSKTATALIVKFLMTFGAAAVAFILIDGNPWGWVFWVGLIGTAVNYTVGDLFVLPKYGNLVASAGDGLLAALLAYIFDLLTVNFNTTLVSLVLFAVVVAVAEYFFHNYLIRAEKVAP